MAKVYAGMDEYCPNVYGKDFIKQFSVCSVLFVLFAQMKSCTVCGCSREILLCDAREMVPD